MTQSSGLYAQFATDPEIEKKGIELIFKMPKDQPDIYFRIARAGGGNAQFQKRLDVLCKPYRRQIQTETIAQETMDDIMRQAYADTVVLGWGKIPKDKNGRELPRVDGVIPGPDGNDLQFNRDNALQLMTDLPDLFADFQQQAQKVSLFRRAQVEEAAKN